MRRLLGPVLVALGAFMIVSAVLARFYVYPRLAVAPSNQASVSTFIGHHATVLDVASLKTITTDLTTTSVIRADIEASEEAPDGVVVWVNTSSTVGDDGLVRSRTVERVAFDEHSAEAVNCCDEYYSGVDGERDQIAHEGLVFKFPFDTQKTDYRFWDSILREARPIRYVGADDDTGVRALKFVQTIMPTVYDTTVIPASVLDIGQEGNVEAVLVYSNKRTLWVEPNTGVILKRKEAQYSTLRYKGKDRLVTTAVTMQSDEKTVSDNADKYGSWGARLNLARTVVPIVALTVGVPLLLAGLLLPFFSPTPRRRT